MSARMVDRIGLRAGAGLSAVALVVGFLAELPIVVPILAVALLWGGLLGSATAPLSLIYRGAKQAFFRNVQPDPEPAAPPRFAQGLGGAVLTASALALYIYEAAGVGWFLALAVAVLQSLLAVTGICIGCEMYLLMKRLQAPRTKAG